MDFPPPEKKVKEMSLVEMVVDKWDKHQLEQLSPVVRFNGYNWRLRLYKFDSTKRYLSLVCDKSREAALWACVATVKSEFSAEPKEMTFASWISDSNPRYISLDEFAEGKFLSVQLLEVKGERPRLRPILGPYDERDGVISIGRQKVHVNKESLSSQSSFFKNLFASTPKRNKPNEWTIDNVTYEDFCNVLNIYYGSDEATLTDETVHSILVLASRFALQVVEDHVISYLLSPSTSFSIHHRLFMADHCTLPYLKDTLIRRYSAAQLKELCVSQAQIWSALSPETTRAMMMKRCEM